MDNSDQAIQRVRSLYTQALTLRQDKDTLLSGQYEAIIGRLSALLSIMGDTLSPQALSAPPSDNAYQLETSTPPMHLYGRVALVTGGGGGLGTMAALALAEAGANVLVVARSLQKCEATAQRVRHLGRRALALSADVTDVNQVNTMVATAIKEFGRIDILFNNAGITSPRTLEETTIDEWWNVMDVNVRGTMLCTKAVAPHMKQQGSGRIINMGSILSDRGMANRSAYCASKAAIYNLTQSLAFELGPFGITVNALGPTVIVTDLNRDMVKTQPALYDSVVKRTPMGRLAEPADVAGPLVFLASDAARFVSGQILFVDGGYTAG